MLKKLILISFCLLLPLAYSQQISNQSILNAQEIEKLSSGEKVAIKESFIETFDQISNEKIEANDTQTASIDILVFIHWVFTTLTHYEHPRTFVKKKS